MTHKRERLSIDPALVIKALPKVGNLMITAKQMGNTHERIGPIEAVTEAADGWLECSGAAHDSRIDPRVITEVVVDRSSVMRDQAYPRIDFSNAEGSVVFSVVGFGGMEPFDAAIVPLGAGEELEDKERPPMGSKEPIVDTDPGLLTFNAVLANGQAVSILYDREGFSQRWSGVVERVNPAMGFINITREDFHLHLRGGALGAWKRVDTADHVDLVARDAEGNATGLVLRGPAAAFENA